MAEVRQPMVEDPGPLLTLGDRVVWLFDHGPEHGWVRFVGRIPVVSTNWAIGVEFDNPVGAGDGKFGGKRYFYAKNDHAFFLPSSSLIRSQDYNSTYDKRGNTVRLSTKVSTLPHRFSTSPRSYVNAGIPRCIFGCHHCLGHGSCSSQAHTGPASKLQRYKSSTLGTKCLRDGQPDSDTWLEGGPNNVCVQSWKSSSTHSVVSCPSMLLPQVAVAQEVSSSSDSGLDLGSLRSLMACFTMGPNRKKVRRKKKRKLVLTASHNSSCSSESKKMSQNDFCNSRIKLDSSQYFPSHVEEKQFYNVTEKVHRKWGSALQEPSGVVVNDNKKEKEDQAAEESPVNLAAELKGQSNSLPIFPAKTATTKKKRPAPKPPVKAVKDYSVLSLGARGAAPPSLHRVHLPSSSLRKSHKKPAPPPPIKYVKESNLRQEVQSTRDNIATETRKVADEVALPSPSKPFSSVEVGTIKKESSIDMAKSSKPFDIRNNIFESTVKPDIRFKEVLLPPEEMPSDVTETNSTAATQKSENGADPDVKPNIDARGSVGYAGSTLRSRPAPVASNGKNDSILSERQVRYVATNKSALCPPIMEEDETYGATTTKNQIDDLEAILKRNSNVLELLDAFNKLEIGTDTAGDCNDLGSPRQQKKQLKPLKSLFQKQEGSKVVSTKWTYTPMEVNIEKPAMSARQETQTHFAARTEEVKRINANVETEEKIVNTSVNPVFSEKGAPLERPAEALAFDLVACRRNLKPINRLPGLGMFASEVKGEAKEGPQNRVTSVTAASTESNAKFPEKSGSVPKAVKVNQNSSIAEEVGKRRTLSACSARITALPNAMSNSPAFTKEPLGRSSPSLSTPSSPRSNSGHVLPPVHPNSPTASMHARVPLLFRQLEEAISKGEHDRAAILARELAMCKVSCSLRRIKKTCADSKQLTVKMFVEDKDSHVGPISVRVHPGMTLRHLKKKIEEEYNFPSQVQRWILGKSLATDDASTLEQYGVTHSECPVFLYLVSPVERKNEVDSAVTPASPTILLKQRGPVTRNSESSEEEYRANEGTAPNTEQVGLAGPTGCDSVPRSRRVSDASSTLDVLLNDKAAGWTCGLCGIKNTEAGSCAMCGAAIATNESPQYDEVPRDDLPSGGEEEDANVKAEETVTETATTQPGNLQDEAAPPKDYLKLIELDEQDLVPNAELFECPICFMDTNAMEGVVLRDCLHSFCKDCLCDAVRYAQEAIIKCPFRNDQYSCDSHLQEREIKALVPPGVYETHLTRSMKTAESQAPNSFHCKTPDCPGWCVLEDNVNVFLCPVCKHTNCLTCRVIHEGKNCLQYQDELEYNAPESQEAKQTKDYLDEMVTAGQAMHCPQCHVIVMKKWGCDWLKCSVCQTEICWVTKGPRWGPNGKGDTSAGCKCGVNGVKCHPKCNYCH
ncbi:uncharacterized protein LOC135377970 [Ornithodoros turicata]|uniref:uncharacterized protein LOC135377970 n=1 Tax=Ornithodoros turicata TaxID=34597 RepID=UPI003139C03C